MFAYLNINPNGEVKGDCVVRAIALGLNLDYYEVVDMLIRNSNFFNCNMLVRDCYGKILSIDFGLPQFNGNGESVGQLASEFNDKILIMRIDGHLTCSKYGIIYDIWDPSDEIVDSFWIVD